MKFDLQTILTAIEASTPDGRWDLLQGWLKENPEYDGLVDQWSTMRPDRVFIQIRNLVALKWEIPAMLLNKFITPEMETRIKSAIETLQTCYRERNNQSEKEIKNVRIRRQTKRRSAKNHR